MEGYIGDFNGRIPVNEIFGPTIQGEGPYIGTPTIFVRVSGCDYKCPKCDTKYAWRTGREDDAKVALLNPSEIFQGILELCREGSTCKSVTLTGGNPACYDLEELVDLLHEAKFNVNVETQGTLCPAWLVKCDLVVVSPKLSGFGMAKDQGFKHFSEFFVKDWNYLHKNRMGDAGIVLKLVVFNQEDFYEAVRFRQAFPFIGLYLQVGNENPQAGDPQELLEKLRWLTSRTLLEPIMQNVTILPQLHVLLWGNKRGV